MVTRLLNPLANLFSSAASRGDRGYFSFRELFKVKALESFAQSREPQHKYIAGL